MSILTTITTRIQKLSPRKSERPLRAPIDPMREWITALLVATLLALGLFGYTGYEFYRQLTDAEKPEVSEESVPRYRASDADLLIQYYEGKKRVFTELRTNKVALPPTGTTTPALEEPFTLESPTPPPPSNLPPTLE